MKGIWFAGLLLVTVSVFAQEKTPAAPPSLPALQRELSGLMFGSRDTPSLAITHDQAQKLLPLLQRWKAADLSLPAADAQDVWDHAQAVLTPDQKAYKFTPSRPAGSGQGGFGQDSQESPHDRQARQLDRLMHRLSSF